MKHLRQFKGSTGDDLLKKVYARYSRGESEQRRGLLAETEKNLRRVDTSTLL